MLFAGADSGTRTHTPGHRNLNPTRLPIPSYPHILLMGSSCCGARCSPRRRRAFVAHRPLPRAQLASSATGGARIASQFHHARIFFCASDFYTERYPRWSVSLDPRSIKTGEPASILESSVLFITVSQDLIYIWQNLVSDLPSELHILVRVK